jgi:hypothetical protein
MLKTATSSEKAKTDPRVLLDARTAIANGTITNSAQLEPYIRDGYLTAGDVNILFNDLKAPDKPELIRITRFLDLAKNLIAKPDPLLGIPDPDGLTSFNAFTYAFEKAYAKGIEKGLSPEELLDPSNKNSLFPLISNYQKNITEIINGTATKMLSDAAKEEPPEEESGTLMQDVKKFLFGPPSTVDANQPVAPKPDSANAELGSVYEKPKMVTTQSDYDAVEGGEYYVGPDNIVRQKLPIPGVKN